MSAELDNWVERYRLAWTTNDADDIRALFTEDATYRTEPFADPWVGHDAIVAGWAGAADEPGRWNFEWVPLVDAGAVRVITATTTYAAGEVYSNLWVIRLADDGRATEFTEWWMEQAAG